MLGLQASLVAALVGLPRSEARGRDSDARGREILWVHEARDGARHAQAALYDLHAPPLLRRLTRLLGRADEAEDVLHDAFLTAFGELKELRDDANFAAWLNRIAVHLVHRRFRRRTLLRRLGMDRGIDDASLKQLAVGGDPSITLQLSRIAGALEKASSAERLAWMLRLVEGCSLQEVAEACSCSLATAKRRIAAAQARVDLVVELDSAEFDSTGEHG
ncbi:MAG TPA: RNA polymerase sigma factor [Polyangiaceae bacterium]|nr:RNA polymerase sigma factor [Polyangiaceae bacterium]